MATVADPRIALASPAMSSADRAAHEAASHVRRTVIPEPTELPALPVEPRARRRELQRRGW